MNTQISSTSIGLLALSCFGVLPAAATVAKVDAPMRPASRIFEYSQEGGSSFLGLPANENAFGVEGTYRPVQVIVERETSAIEKVIGELRRYSLLKKNWDGEGASSPNTASFLDSVMFSCLLFENSFVPEPMVHSSGHAGLYWKSEQVYGDLEFLGDGRIAYYIEIDQDKHKGIVHFDGKLMPPLFQTLLRLESYSLQTA